MRHDNASLTCKQLDIQWYIDIYVPVQYQMHVPVFGAAIFGSVVSPVSPTSPEAPAYFKQYVLEFAWDLGIYSGALKYNVWYIETCDGTLKYTFGIQYQANPMQAAPPDAAPARQSRGLRCAKQGTMWVYPYIFSFFISWYLDVYNIRFPPPC